MEIYSLVAKINETGVFEKEDKHPIIDNNYTDIETLNLILKYGMGAMLQDLKGSTFYNSNICYGDDELENYGYFDRDDLLELLKDNTNLYYVSSNFWKEFTERGGELPKGMGVSYVGTHDVAFDIVDKGYSDEFAIIRKILRTLKDDEIICLAFKNVTR